MSDEATKRTCPQCQAALPADAPEGLCPACLLKAGAAASGASVSQATTGDAVPPPISGTPASGSSFTPPTVEELTPHFPQLEILELLGQGGMGAVYRARQKHLDRIVALKVLPGELGQDPAFAERFAREARALARLNHPNVINVFDYGQAGGHFFILMEYVDGANLREIQRTGRLSAEQALKIVPQLCEALQYAHDEGVVHRDIKPENILFDRKGRVKIADFGLAKLAARTTGEAAALTGSNQVVGTWQYMAPEQVEHAREVDHRADIYSMGVVLYEMLTGELPLGRFEPPSHKIQLDVRLDEVVLKTLEKDPARRYQQAEDVKTDVEQISAHAPKEEPGQQQDTAQKTAQGVKIDSDGIRVTGPDGSVSVGWDGVNVTDHGRHPDTDEQRVRHKLAFYGVGLAIEGAALVVWILTLMTGGLTWATIPYCMALLLAGPFIMCGAIQMLTLRSLAWSYASAVLALISVPFWYEQTWWLIWIPVAVFNISGLNALGGRRTQSAFLAVRQRNGTSTWSRILLPLIAVIAAVLLGGAAFFATFLSGTSKTIHASSNAPSVLERVRGITVQTARLKGYFTTNAGAGYRRGTVVTGSIPPDLTKAIDDAEQCSTELYALAQEEIAGPSARAALQSTATSHAQRARETLHRMQVALGLLESRGAQCLPEQSSTPWRKDVQELQRDVSALMDCAEEIGAMDPIKFSELNNRLFDEFNVLRKVEAIQDAARRHRFTTKQAMRLLEEFENTGSPEAQLVEILIPRLTDSENAAQLWSRLVEADRKRIRAQWESRSQAPALEAEQAPSTSQ